MCTYPEQASAKIPICDKPTQHTGMKLKWDWNVIMIQIYNSLHALNMIYITLNINS